MNPLGPILVEKLLRGWVNQAILRLPLGEIKKDTSCQIIGEIPNFQIDLYNLLLSGSDWEEMTPLGTAALITKLSY